MLLGCNIMINTMSHSIYTSDQLTDEICKDVSLASLKSVHEKLDNQTPLFVIDAAHRQEVTDKNVTDTA